jgi:hypothetical protein
MTKFKNSMVAAIIAVAAIGCGVAPEEGVVAYDDNGRNTPAPTAPAEPTVDTDTDAEVIEDGCEAFGLTYDAANNTCVDDEYETNIIDIDDEYDLEVDTETDLGGGEWETATINEENDIINPFMFSVTPGKYELVATWETNDDVSSFRIERTREGNSYSNDSYPSGTSWTYATFSCSAHSFKLVANMMDGSVVETETTVFMKPTNCE